MCIRDSKKLYTLTPAAPTTHCCRTERDAVYPGAQNEPFRVISGRGGASSALLPDQSAAAPQMAATLLLLHTRSEIRTYDTSDRSSGPAHWFSVYRSLFLIQEDSQGILQYMFRIQHISLHLFGFLFGRYRLQLLSAYLFLLIGTVKNTDPCRYAHGGCCWLYRCVATRGLSSPHFRVLCRSSAA